MGCPSALLLAPAGLGTAADPVQRATYVKRRQLVGVELHFLPEGDRSLDAFLAGWKPKIAGRAVLGHLNEETFRRVVSGLILVLGLWLLVS